MRLLRETLFEGSRVPVVVVGNKADCLPPVRSSAHPEHHASHAEPPVALFRDLSALIRKQWKWAYVEVSALHGWHVQALLQRVLHSLSHSRLTGSDSTAGEQAVARPSQPAPRPAPSPHCHIL